LRYFVATPLILVVLIPVVITDIVLELYHQIAFPIFGIRRVRCSEYIRIFDRERLPYLTWYEKFGCAYCGYVNGWLHYASTIAGRTEAYFCAISHLKTRGYKPSEHEKMFMKYGDEGALRKRYHAHHLKYEKENKN
jgi:hypothetical protein